MTAKLCIQSGLALLLAMGLLNGRAAYGQSVNSEAITFEAITEYLKFLRSHEDWGRSLYHPSHKRWRKMSTAIEAFDYKMLGDLNSPAFFNSCGAMLYPLTTLDPKTEDFDRPINTQDLKLMCANVALGIRLRNLSGAADEELQQLAAEVKAWLGKMLDPRQSA